MNPVCFFFYKCFIYFFTFIYSIGFCIWLLCYIVTHPRTKFWKKKEREHPPPCLLDPSWGTHGYLQLKDVRLHYVENGDRSKPLMLFIHGFPEFWYSWRYQLREFSKDYWTVALDLRGYGESDKPNSMSSYIMENIIEDMRQAVLSLGREKITLVGHDWGGLLVWNFLDFHSSMVDKYIIMDSPHHKDWTAAMAKYPKQFKMSWYCFFFQVPLLPELALSMNDFAKFDKVINYHNSGSKYFSKDDMEAFKYTFSKPGALTHAVNYYRANCGRLYLQDSGPKYSPQGLLIFGENDDYLVKEFLEMAKKVVENLQTYLVKDANHFVQQDQPDQVNKIMRTFLEGKTV